MKIYCLEATVYEPGEIQQTVVIAENKERAIDIARTQRNTKWRITAEIDTVDAAPQLIASYIRTE